MAVEGFFAFVWFGWGQASAPSWLVVPLAVGTGLAVLLAVAGVVVTRRSAGRLRVMADPRARRRYGIIVGLEFGLLGAGAAVLGATGQYRWTPVLICAGVGAHFFPLASTLGQGEPIAPRCGAVRRTAAGRCSTTRARSRHVDRAHGRVSAWALPGGSGGGGAWRPAPTWRWWPSGGRPVSPPAPETRPSDHARTATETVRSCVPTTRVQGCGENAATHQD